MNNHYLSYKKIIFIFIITLSFLGCRKVAIVRDGVTDIPPHQVAILPMKNTTNDVLAQQVLRNYIYVTLVQYGYTVQDLEETDRALREYGITQGAQLDLFSPLEISAIVNSDGLLYTHLEEANLSTYPYYHSRSLYVFYSLYTYGMLNNEGGLYIKNSYFDLYSALRTIDDPETGAIIASGVAAAHQAYGIATAGASGHKLAPEMRDLANTFTKIIPKYSEGINHFDKNKLKNIKEKIDNNEEIGEPKIEYTNNRKGVINRGGFQFLF